MKNLEQLVRLVSLFKGRVFLTGGALRNRLLGRPEGDRDYEVHGLITTKLHSQLCQVFENVRWVGKSFPVFHVRLEDGSHIDFSIPRRNGIPIHTVNDPGRLLAPFIGIAEAQRGRDFTIDAIYRDEATGEMIDHFGGRTDLERKIIRHVDPATFPDDPVRVLRAGRLSAELGFDIAEETEKLCREIDLGGVAPERLYSEWTKLLLQSPRPSVGVEAFRRLGAFRLFPELEEMRGVPQDPEFHPEGDVYTHTLMVLDEAAEITRGMEETDRLVVLLGALCHDMGKPATTERLPSGQITSHKHTVVGIDIALGFLRRLTADHRILETVPKLVFHHLDHLNAFAMGDKAVRRLRMSIGPHFLIPLIRADTWGRTGGREDSKGNALVDRLEERFASLSPELDPPLIKGRHLIRLGLVPGPRFGEILGRVYELQLEGEFNTEEEGFRKLREIVEREISSGGGFTP